VPPSACRTSASSIQKITMHLAYTVAEIVGENGKWPVSSWSPSPTVKRSAAGGRSVRVRRSGRQSELVKGHVRAGRSRLRESGPQRTDFLRGLYAAGDVTDYELKQVITAAARGAFCRLPCGALAGDPRPGLLSDSCRSATLDRAA